MAEKKKSKLPITIFELVVYILAGLLGIWGIVYISLGISTNFVRFDSKLIEVDTGLKANTNGMGFLEQGILILVCAVLPIVVLLLVNAKTSDREFEKEQRRKQARFNRKNKNNEQEEIVVDVETTPVEEAPAQEEPAPEETPVEESQQEEPVQEEQPEEAPAEEEKPAE